MFKLLPSQKALLYDVLTSSNFNPLDFDIVKTHGGGALGDGEAVELKESEFYFAIYSHPGEYSPARFFVTFSPGAQQITESRECHDWGSIVRAFQYYLGVLRREWSVADPWENAKEYAAKLQAAPEPNA